MGLGSGIRKKWKGKQLMTNFVVKISIILSVLAKKIPLPVQKSNYYPNNFMIFVDTKIGRTKNLFSPPLLVVLLDLGSGMDKNQDQGFGINVPDPQH
jgi:hypothetical protein